MKSIIWFFVAGFVLILTLYGVYSLVGISVGTFMDWLIGILAVMWLFAIVTVPWNAHFRAREILDEAEISKRKDILVIESSLEFARRIVKRSLFIAILLHVVSAIGLYALAVFSITPVGYVGAILAVLLAFLRPAMRSYEYIQTRLASIREEFRYPRQDINELLGDIRTIKETLKKLDDMLANKDDKPSWRKDIDLFVEETNLHFEEIETTAQETTKKTELLIANTKQGLQKEIETVGNEHKAAFQRIAVDSQILDSVRVLAHFVRQLKE